MPRTFIYKNKQKIDPSLCTVCGKAKSIYKHLVKTRDSVDPESFQEIINCIVKLIAQSP